MARSTDTDSAKKPGKSKASEYISAGAALSAHLDAGRLHPVYLVTSALVERSGRNEEKPGAAPKALADAAALIEARALKAGDASVDRVHIDYLDGDHQGTGIHALIVHESRSVSLFGGCRVITVLHCDDLVFGADEGEESEESKPRSRKKAKGEDPLEKLIVSLEDDGRPPHFVLILVAEHFQRHRKAFQTLAAAGAVVEVPPLTPEGLQAYLEDEGKPWNIRVEHRVAGEIWNRLGGSDASRLRQTADRMLLDAGPNGQITVQMVEESVPVDRESQVWAITDALAANDRTRALVVLHLMLDHATASETTGIALQIMGFFNSQYQLLVRVAALRADGTPDQAIAGRIGVHPFRCDKLVAQVRQARPGYLENAIAVLAACDQILKSSALGDSRLSTIRWMEQMVLALAKGRPLRLPLTRSAMEAI